MSHIFNEVFNQQESNHNLATLCVCVAPLYLKNHWTNLDETLQGISVWPNEWHGRIGILKFALVHYLGVLGAPFSWLTIFGIHNITFTTYVRTPCPNAVSERRVRTSVRMPCPNAVRTLSERPSERRDRALFGHTGGEQLRPEAAKLRVWFRKWICVIHFECNKTNHNSGVIDRRDFLTLFLQC